MFIACGCISVWLFVLFLLFILVDAWLLLLFAFFNFFFCCLERLDRFILFRHFDQFDRSARAESVSTRCIWQKISRHMVLWGQLDDWCVRYRYQFENELFFVRSLSPFFSFFSLSLFHAFVNHLLYGLPKWVLCQKGYPISIEWNRGRTRALQYFILKKFNWCISCVFNNHIYK